jgi:hypothetical protein
MERLQALSMWWAAPILMAFISTIYFVTSPSNATIRNRILVSSHGAIAAALYLGAMAVWALGASRQWLGWPFLVAQIVPVAFIVIALAQFRGSRLVHILQPFNLLCMVWAYVIGIMAITGEWL